VPPPLWSLPLGRRGAYRGGGASATHTHLLWTRATGRFASAALLHKSTHAHAHSPVLFFTRWLALRAHASLFLPFGLFVGTHKHPHPPCLVHDNHMPFSLCFSLLFSALFVATYVALSTALGNGSQCMLQRVGVICSSMDSEALTGTSKLRAGAHGSRRQQPGDDPQVHQQ
jgi:hypothetical protein